MSETPTRYEPYSPGRPAPETPWRPSDAVQRADQGDVRPADEHESRFGGASDCLVVASVVCVVIWATSGFGYFWPIWVLLPTFLPRILGQRGRQRVAPRRTRSRCRRA
jgi:hypothetical protein